MSGWLRIAVAGGAVAAVLLTARSARSDDPVSSAVRYNREIVRIFDRKCLSCHGPGSIGMPLSSYREVRPWSRAIREEIVEGHMPPTSAVRGYARLKDDIALTPRELATILTWVDGGVPRGDESDLPPLPKPAPAVEPDHAVPLPDQQLPGDGADVVRTVTTETGLQEDRWVRLLQFRPGDRRLLRAAFVSIAAPAGTPVWAGSWVPWQTEVSAPTPGAFRVPRGSRLTVELHYRAGEAPAVDKSSVALFFAPDGTWQAMESLALTPVPATAKSKVPVGKAEATIKKDVVLWGIRLELPADGPAVEVTARKPGGQVDVLLWVPRARADWPAPFIFQEPVSLPAGSVIAVTSSGTPGQLRTRTILTFHNAP